MAKVHIRGRKEPLEIANSQALDLQEALKTADRSAVVQVGLMAVRASEVKLIDIQVEVPDQSASDQFKQWSASRSAFLRLPLEEKINKVFAGFVPLCSELLGIEFNETLRQRLTDWFKENRYRTIPDFSLFTDDLPLGFGKGKKIDPYKDRVFTLLGITIGDDKKIAQEQEQYAQSRSLL